jgi:glycosyltransferase involved in cell wall biosynthesis
VNGAPSGVRVLHVFSTFAPGGPQVRTARLLPALERSWRHQILALDGCTEARGLLDPALACEILTAPPRAGTPRTTLALARRLRALRPDLLLTYNFGALDALLAARLVRLRAVVHHEDGFLPDEVRAFKRRRVWARRLLLPGVRAVIVPSFRLEELALRLWRLDAERVHRIPNGIRPADFPLRDGNPSRRSELGIPPDAVVIGLVGHLRAEKNPVRAVQAMREVPAHLLILGDGPERASVERRARELGVAERVHLVGHRQAPQDDYRAMDAFVLSSDTEQMPVALLEAMAAGLPVAATDVGDVRRILPSEGAELVVPAVDPPLALAQALLRLAADPGLRARLGQANRARVAREFSFERMVAAYREVYESALASCRAGARSR